MKVRDLALASIFAALYAALVVFLAVISFQLVQVRLADALIPLSIVFGWPAVVGVTIGCVVSNAISPLPSVVIDVAFGSVANFVGSFLAWKVGRSKGRESLVNEFLGCSVATIVITFMVGTYLAMITEMELWIWWLGIGIGSVVSINILGYILIQLMKKLKF